MAAITTLVLADGASPPANHAFVPMSPQVGDSPAEWQNVETETLIGSRKVTLRVRAVNGNYEVTAKISDPVLSAIPDDCCTPQNVPAVAYTSIAELKFRLPSASTLVSRKNILAFAKNLLASAPLSDAVLQIQKTW